MAWDLAEVGFNLSGSKEGISRQNAAEGAQRSGVECLPEEPQLHFVGEGSLNRKVIARVESQIAWVQIQL